MASKTKSTRKNSKPAVVETPVVEETPKVKAPRFTPIEADTLAWIAAHARPAVSPCLCGCGEQTKSRFFPGHDATLKERLKATVANGDDASKATAEATLAVFGW